MTEYIQEIEKIINIYYNTTNINCRVYRVHDMEYTGCTECEQTPDFCRFVYNYKKSRYDCNNSYLYAARQAEKLGDSYIYFCPYGLVNWSVPIFIDNQIEYFLVGGPILLHHVDELLLEDIFKQNSLLRKHIGLIKNKLKEIPYADPVKTRYLAKLLMCLAESEQKSLILEDRRKKNFFSSYLGESIQELKEKKQREGVFNKKPESYPIELERRLISKIKTADKEGAIRILNKLLGHIYFNNKDFVIVKARTIELMAVLGRVAIEIGADLEIIFGLEYMLHNKLRQVEDINDLSECLSKILERFIESTFIIRKAKNIDIIYKAMNYIRSNYYNKDISLSVVAREVGLSVSYFSKLFKEETGLSYSVYLNKVRVCVSKELLKKNIPIVEVASTVGFNDQSYFSRVFKKIEGISPGKYIDIS